MLIKNHIRFSRFLSLLLQTNLLVKTDYNMDKKQYNVLDLFCGCGGMSLGFEKAGYHVLLGIDNWKDALTTYEYNHNNSSTLCADLSTLMPQEVDEKINHESVDVIIGGPPCQGFSIAGKRIIDDERNKLYKAFLRMVAYFKPQAFVMENVPNILSMGNGAIKNMIIKDFEELGYAVVNKVLMASDYGVPQNRRRAIFVGMLENKKFDYPLKSIEVPVTSWEALSDLPEDSLKDGENYPCETLSEYQTLMRKNSKGIYNHEVTVHNEKTTKIIALVPDGGNYKDLPHELQNTRKVNIAWTRLNSQKPSITIDTGHRHHFHYKYNRIPTARESARIQSFPDDFIFLCSRTSQLKQIGNAVPPLLAHAIAEQLKITMEKEPEEIVETKTEDTKTMEKKDSKSFYQIPDKYWQRIHFVRPRFKNNIESVLLYMASECCRIPRLTCKEYNKAYYNAIRMFPGNQGMSKKTLDNWRTEIPALFGFYTENKQLNYTQTSKMAVFLDENQDLTQFMKFFLYTFQFPGGHLKARDIQELTDRNVRFKPAQLILKVLMAGNVLLSEMNKAAEMSISSQEATYCIFNDLRVTSGEIDPKTIAQAILANRRQKIKYYDKNDYKIFSSKDKARSLGDVTRYAGDILDYMELANLLIRHNGYYYLKPDEKETIDIFINDKTFFNGYEKFYGKYDSEIAEIAAVESEWFEYVNNSLQPDLFKTDISKLLPPTIELQLIYDQRIKEMITNEDTRTKDIGNIGESLIYGHEKMRLKLAGYKDMLHRIQIVDSPSYHPGYDIDSLEGDGTNDHRYIEVKTTISKRKLQLYAFHMSPNEWDVAGTHKEHYCIYRLMLSTTDKLLYIFRNPVGLYKQDAINASPRNGMEISFDINNFKQTELLTWQD